MSKNNNQSTLEQELKAMGMKFPGLEDIKLDPPITDMDQLPFVSSKKKKDRKFWNVKPTGEIGTPGTYISDCNQGHEYAQLYLNYLLNASIAPLPLTWIVSEMNNLDDDNKGVSVGFLTALQDYAMLAVQHIQAKK